MFRIEFDTDNDAFAGNFRNLEIIRILEQLIDTIKQNGLSDHSCFPIRDINGNSIGSGVYKKGPSNMIKIIKKTS